MADSFSPPPSAFGLGGLAEICDSETRSISAENPDGRKGGGARAEPGGSGPAADLGRGWKVRPYIALPAGETVTLAEIEGPGVIQHIWMTVKEQAYRAAVLRCYWDGEDTPSVEVPLGDFFCNGHGLRYNVNSLPVAVNPVGGFNCYWPMPFRRHARITIENQWREPIDGFFYQIDYALNPVHETAGQFHAQWRRSVTSRERPEHTIADDIAGRGHYVGSFLAWTQCSSGWWGEGEVKYFIDGDGEFPTICGTGTEDYVGGAWCFKDETYSTPFLGYPLNAQESGRPPRHALYRWHVMDPVRFKKDLRVTIQALGWWPGGRYEPLTDDIASVAYWYQTEPHGPFPVLADMSGRWPR